MRTAAAACLLLPLLLLGCSCSLVPQKGGRCPDAKAPASLFAASADFNRSLGALRFDFNASADYKRFKENGTFGLLFSANDSSVVTIGNGSEQYRPRSLQWLLRSEHRLEGRDFPLEAQLLLLPLDGAGAQPAAVSWLYDFDENRADADAALAAVAQIFVGNATDEGAARPALQRLLPQAPVGRFFRYDGGVRAPLCGGVRWSVLADPAGISNATLLRLRRIAAGSGEFRVAAANFTAERSFDSASPRTRKQIGDGQDTDDKAASAASVHHYLLLLMLLLLLQ